MSAAPNAPYQSPAPRRTPILQYVLVGILIVLVALLLWRNWPHGQAPIDATPRAVTPRGDSGPRRANDGRTCFAPRRRRLYISPLTASPATDSRCAPSKCPKGPDQGFVWDKSGHVVTNYHVIRGADVAYVALADHSSWKATFRSELPPRRTWPCCASKLQPTNWCRFPSALRTICRSA